MEAYIFVAAAAITALIALFKNAKKGTILKSVIKGVEDSAKFVPEKDLRKVKSIITEKAAEYGVGNALNKVVRYLTK